MTHESVEEAAVIGIYVEEEATEFPVACVLLKQNVPQTDILKNEIRNFVTFKVAEYKKLRGIYFTDQIPKNASGKILRRELLKSFIDKFEAKNPFYTTNQREYDKIGILTCSQIKKNKKNNFLNIR
jgi:acyl-coenzyme A synthetase/AMP-(fatty) acid ligase